jgi:hypothetical protein
MRRSKNFEDYNELEVRENNPFNHYGRKKSLEKVISEQYLERKKNMPIRNLETVSVIKENAGRQTENIFSRINKELDAHLNITKKRIYKTKAIKRKIKRKFERKYPHITTD